MADRYSERGGQRWDESERRFRDRESSYDRGFLERFADEMRSWFGNEEAQRRRMMDEREDWRGERGRSDWGGRDRWRDDWSRAEWPRSESSRSSSEWMRGPDERQWSRDWGWIEGRGRDYGTGAYGSSGYGVGRSGGYGQWGRDRDWEHPARESRDYGSRAWMTLGGPHSGRGPRNYQRSDERIREDLCERFTQHSYLDPSDIDIRVQNGQVTLDGSVSDRQAKRTAEDIAEGVSGVTEVQNRLRIVQVELGQDPREGQQDQPGTGPHRGTWAA